MLEPGRGGKGFSGYGLVWLGALVKLEKHAFPKIRRIQQRPVSLTPVKLEIKNLLHLDGTTWLRMCSKETRSIQHRPFRILIMRSVPWQVLMGHLSLAVEMQASPNHTLCMHLTEHGNCENCFLTNMHMN